MTGFKTRLQQAKNNSEKIMLTFMYPASTKRIIRKGIVIATNEDCFDFKDRYEGLMTFSYDFLIEVSEWREG